MTVGKSLKNSKRENNSKVAGGKSRSRASSGDVETVISKRKGHSGSRKAQSGEIEGSGVHYAGGSKTDKKGIIVKKNVNRKIKGEANELVTNGNREFEYSDRKRKRIYADHSTDEGTISSDSVRKPSRKLSSEMLGDNLEGHLHQEKRTSKGKMQPFEQLSRKNMLAGESKPKASKLLDKKQLRAKVRVKDELRDVEDHGFRNVNLKRGAKIKSGVAKQLEQNRAQRPADLLPKSSRKKVPTKKTSSDDSNVMDDQPKKKKKRVIRIDPHDLSNKRLDDGVSINSQYLY